jgi:hypothetical protein
MAPGSEARSSPSVLTGPVAEDRQPHRRIRSRPLRNQTKLRRCECNRARKIRQWELVWGSVTWVPPTQPGF